MCERYGSSNKTSNNVFEHNQTIDAIVTKVKKMGGNTFKSKIDVSVTKNTKIYFLSIKKWDLNESATLKNN